MNDASQAELVIDLEAYRRNLELVVGVVAPARLMAVLKSDAYGHGLLPLARVACEAGIRDLGALDISTALALRADGIPREVSVLAWLLSPHDDFAAAVDGGVELGISSVAELRTIVNSGASEPARLHLKIDTGLHRNGANEKDWPGLVTAAVDAERAGTAIIAGVWTHIAEASDADDSAAIARFDSAIAVGESLGASFPTRHLAASAAGFTRADARFDMVRIGAFGYGISPGSGISPSQLGLEPVMTLRSRIGGIRPQGDAFELTVPLGFGDGLAGECAGRVEVSIAGQRHPIVAVGIDSVTVLSPREYERGDDVVFFGTGSAGEQTLQEWADALGTIGEEIVVRLSPRLVRRYLGSLN